MYYLQLWMKHLYRKIRLSQVQVLLVLESLEPQLFLNLMTLIHLSPYTLEQKNQAYLDSEVHVSYSGENLPDLGDTMEPDVEDMELTLKYNSSDTEATALTTYTTFRALNEKEKIMTAKNGKFERIEKASNDSENDEDK